MYVPRLNVAAFVQDIISSGLRGRGCEKQRGREVGSIVSCVVIVGAGVCASASPVSVLGNNSWFSSLSSSSEEGSSLSTDPRVSIWAWVILCTAVPTHIHTRTCTHTHVHTQTRAHMHARAQKQRGECLSTAVATVFATFGVLKSSAHSNGQPAYSQERTMWPSGL